MEAWTCFQVARIENETESKLLRKKRIDDAWLWLSVETERKEASQVDTPAWALTCPDLQCRDRLVKGAQDGIYKEKHDKHLLAGNVMVVLLGNRHFKRMLFFL